MGACFCGVSPRAPCCPANALPYMNPPPDYKEKGKWIKLKLGIEQSIDAYSVIKEGSAVKCGLVVSPDANGVKSGRHVALCDSLAEALPGLLVIMPDVFEGKPIIAAPPGCVGVTTCMMIGMIWGFGITGTSMKYFKTFGWEDVGGRTVSQKTLYMDMALPYLREQGAKKIVFLGICFGAYAAFKVSATGEISAAATFHPSVRQMCEFFSEDDIGIAKSIKCPQYLVHTHGDGDTWLPGAEAHAGANAAVSGNKWMKTDAPHGFFSRGDPNDPITRAEITKHVDGIVEFFSENLTLPKGQ